MANFHWTCAFCNHAQTVIEAKSYSGASHIYIDGLIEGSVSIVHRSIGCSNNDCRRLTTTVWIQPDHGSDHDYALNAVQRAVVLRALLPESEAKPQPEFIPFALREDYLEACRIRDLSPKASATLARRCLQGMIRNFAGISRARLIDEIDALRTAAANGTAPQGVTSDTVEAIDHVRGVGNIGAHMERDIDVIVPVDPGEAQALIELIEMLFDEWYVARERRRQRLATIEKIGTEKKNLLAMGKAPVDAGPEESTVPEVAASMLGKAAESPNSDGS